MSSQDVKVPQEQFVIYPWNIQTLLNIDFRELLACKFIGFIPIIPQWFLFICCVHVFHLWEISRRCFAFIMPVEGLQVYQHVEGVGQNKKQNQRHHQAHQNCWGE